MKDAVDISRDLYSNDEMMLASRLHHQRARGLNLSPLFFGFLNHFLMTNTHALNSTELSAAKANTYLRRWQISIYLRRLGRAENK